MAKIQVFSKFDFDELCYQNNWSDWNVESLGDKAFISICCTQDVAEHHLEEKDEHWFNESHPNVLNLDFDDIETDTKFGDNEEYIARAMTEDEATEILEFVEKNLGKDIYIHCRAGASRSQGVFRAVCAIWPDIYDEKENYNENNPCITPNIHVVRLLKRVAMQKLENNDKQGSEGIIDEVQSMEKG